MLINLVAFSIILILLRGISVTYEYRENGATTDSLDRVNSTTVNVTNVDYQPLLRTSVTVTGALLASLGGCSITEMSLGLNVSITVESGNQGTCSY